MLTTSPRWNFAGRLQKRISHQTQLFAASADHKACWSLKKSWIALRVGLVWPRKLCANEIFIVAKGKPTRPTMARRLKTIEFKPFGRRSRNRAHWQVAERSWPDGMLRMHTRNAALQSLQ